MLRALHAAPRESVRLLRGLIRFQGKKSWLGIAPSQLIRASINRCALIAVVMRPVVAVVLPIPPIIVPPPSVVIRSIIWRAPVIAVIAARVVSIISRISVAISVSRVTESDSDWSDPD